jgi:methionyl-tRNA formyltransferase
MEKIKFIFFGTSGFSVIILEKLKEAGFVLALIITGEDKPKGRHLILTPPPVKIWAEKNNIPFLQPHSLKDESLRSTLHDLRSTLFLVASYGKIIPQSILDIPKHGALNVHPSLLPKLRGASPIQGAILTENQTGVTIMRMDAEMDHGPIVTQREVEVDDWPPYSMDLEKILAEEGGKLLVEILPAWFNGDLKEIEQDHYKATYTKKITKDDAHIDLSENPQTNLRKIRAYAGWPNAFTFFIKDEKRIRVVIKRAHIDAGELILERVVPEGKKEMSYEEFRNGFLKS